MRNLKWIAAIALATFGAAQAVDSRRNCLTISCSCAMSRRLSGRTSATPARNNFVGRPLAGYDGAECVVKRPVALALQKVQQRSWRRKNCP